MRVFRRLGLGCVAVLFILLVPPTIYGLLTGNSAPAPMLGLLIVIAGLVVVGMVAYVIYELVDRRSR